MSVLTVKTGIFHSISDSGMCIQSIEEDSHTLEEILNPYLGKPCEVHLHFMPKSPRLSGGGSCLWGETCPVHSSNPDYFLHFSSSGEITASDGSFQVGDKTLPLDLMEGHFGRLIVFRNPPSCIEEGKDPVESLLEEAQSLESLLSGLRELV